MAKLKPGDLVWVAWEDAFTDDNERVYLIGGRVTNDLEHGHIDGRTEMPAYYIGHSLRWLLLAWFFNPSAEDEEYRWAGTFRLPMGMVREVKRVELGKKVKLK